MKSEIIKLLEQIESGISIFEPYHRKASDMVEFQHTVECLFEMKRLGLIRHAYTEKHVIAGREYCDLISVPGGMTEEGRELLRQYRARGKNGEQENLDNM